MDDVVETVVEQGEGLLGILWSMLIDLLGSSALLRSLLLLLLLWATLERSLLMLERPWWRGVGRRSGAERPGRGIGETGRS